MNLKKIVCAACIGLISVSLNSCMTVAETMKRSYPSMTSEFPMFTDPSQDSLYRIYQKLEPNFSDPNFFTQPATPAKIDCEISKKDLYVPVELSKLVKDSSLEAEEKKLDKALKKYWRQQGVNPDEAMAPKPTYSNDVVTLLRGTCKDRVLDGNVEILGEYDQESKQESESNNIKSKTTVRKHVKIRVVALFYQGKFIKDLFKYFTSVTQQNVQSSDLNTQASADQINNTPLLSKILVINPIDSNSLSAVFTLGENLYQDKSKLWVSNTTFEKEGAEGRRTETFYVGTQLQSIKHYKDIYPQGFSYSYMKLTPTQAKAMEPQYGPSRMVTANGEEFAEFRRCYINGVRAQTDECPE